MKLNEIKERLCNYDTRNPNGVISYLSKEEIKEEGYTDKRKENCYCDSCHRGNTQLAEELLKYIKK